MCTCDCTLFTVGGNNCKQLDETSNKPDWEPIYARSEHSSPGTKLFLYCAGTEPDTCRNNH